MPVIFADGARSCVRRALPATDSASIGSRRNRAASACAPPKHCKKRLKDNARATRPAGGGDERTLLGLLSAVDRRVAKVRQRADADADAARDAAQQAQHGEACEHSTAAGHGYSTSGGGAADAPDVQALADAASQLHQVCCLECAAHAVHAVAASVCAMMPSMRRRRGKGHSCYVMYCTSMSVCSAAASGRDLTSVGAGSLLEPPTLKSSHRPYSH